MSPFIRTENRAYDAEWKRLVREYDSANAIIAADVSVGDSEIRSKWEADALGKLRVDQMKEFLKSKSLPTSGKKADLAERIGEWLESHPT
ncbi:hypothetical protein OF83DRAFT_1288839 [Amylostereum chailletii]|nr:hypothetical protein OF83DRAFT_1288839 [Amylostereum chailletii]